MPAQLSYPGVYIEEIPSSVHTITGVATSITAFVGPAEWGPVNTSTIINSYADFDRMFGGLWAQSEMSFAVNDFFGNGGSQAVIVRLAPADARTATFTLPEDSSSPGSPPADVLGDLYMSLNLEAANPGAWGSNLSVSIDHNTKNPNDVTLFNLTASLTDPITNKTLITEKYLNLSTDPASSRYVTTTLAQNSQLLAVQESNTTDEVPPIRPAATFTPVIGQGGSDGTVLTDNDFIGGQTAADKQGLYALENTDLFNILCLPPFAGDNISQNLIAAAAEYCERRRAFFLVDAPSTWTSVQTAQTQFTNNGVGTSSANAGVYFPRLIEQNPLLDNQLDTFVPCGAVAGIFARTDAQRGVWKAPAGQDAVLNGVSQLSVPLTDMENGQLNPLGVNCLRSFPIIGRVVWGARTLQGADVLESQWKYVPVRRFALFLEDSLYRGTKWVVFEPNDETLWSAIRLNVGSFMQNLFQQGAFPGTSPTTAYFVKCDSESTTPYDVDQGIVNIVVGFAPLVPAEFVVIQIEQIAGQAQV